MVNTITQPASDAIAPPPSDPTSSSSTGTSSTLLCFACNKPGSSVCSRCQNARYCSVECQEKDFKVHQMLCKSFAELGPRPGPKYFRGIFFPNEEIWPYFVWNEYLDANLCTTIQLKEHLIGGALRHTQFDRNRTLKRMLGYKIGVGQQDLSVLLAPNLSLTSLLGPKIAWSLRGPFLAHGFRHLDEKGDELGDDATPLDLDTSALVHLHEFLSKWVRVMEGEWFPDWDDEFECWERPPPGGSNTMNASRN